MKAHKAPVASEGYWCFMAVALCQLFCFLELLEQVKQCRHLQQCLAELQSVGRTTAQVNALHACCVFVNPNDLDNLTECSFLRDVEHALAIWITLSS